jgi:serine/threonine-protein kinase
MSQSPGPAYDTLSAAGAQRVNQISERFEKAWITGGQPRLEEFLAEAPEPERPAVVCELVRVELYYRRKGGDDPTPEEYRGRFPEHADLLDAVFQEQSPASPTGDPSADPGQAPGGSNSPTPNAGGEVPTMTYSPLLPEPEGSLSYVVVSGKRQVGHLPSQEAQAQVAAAFAPGKVLQDRYLLRRELGKGGMGVVFLGHDQRLDRSVAIKVILPVEPAGGNRASVEVKLRMAFSQEARLGANLTHPAIATVYDYGFHEGNPFTVFEYIQGETLRELLTRRAPLPLEEVRRIVGPLAQALDFAHARHVVHRDLKPENIRSSVQGFFKILDLGLAKEFRRQDDWHFAGTPAYASPEQAANLPCDGRTDQYTLAHIAFEMLTGQRLFEHTDYWLVLEMHRHQPPPWPRGIRTDLPDGVCSALMRALSKDPNLRFPSCEEFAAALGCQVAGAPPPRTSEVPLPRPQSADGRRGVRKGLVIGLCISGAILLLAGLGLVLLLLE